jgi:hypothetical protein
MLSLHDLARAKNILYGETNEKDSWRRVPSGKFVGLPLCVSFGLELPSAGILT